jgi:hypothetical protein
MESFASTLFTDTKVDVPEVDDADLDAYLRGVEGADC